VIHLPGGRHCGREKKEKKERGKRKGGRGKERVPSFLSYALSAALFHSQRTFQGPEGEGEKKKEGGGREEENVLASNLSYYIKYTATNYTI